MGKSWFLDFQTTKQTFYKKEKLYWSNLTSMQQKVVSCFCKILSSLLNNNSTFILNVSHLIFNFINLWKNNKESCIIKYSQLFSLFFLWDWGQRRRPSSWTSRAKSTLFSRFQKSTMDVSRGKRKQLKRPGRITKIWSAKHFPLLSFRRIIKKSSVL